MPPGVVGRKGKLRMALKAKEAALSAQSPVSPPRYHFTINEMASEERPRERLRNYGAQSLSTPELLAIILRTGTSRENVITLASKLLNKYHGLTGLARADFTELCNEYGLGEAKSCQLKAALELGIRLGKASSSDKPQIRTPTDAANLVMLDMSYLDHEQLRILVLDTKNQVVDNIDRYKGTVNSSVLRASEIFRPAVTRNCPGVLICHNHPSGDPTPSQEDLLVTKQLVEAGRLLDIELIDHLVIGDNRFVSIKEHLKW